MSSESALVSALRERLRLIADEPSRRQPEQHLERLREVSEQIDRIVAALPRPIPVQLEHYLQRQSYDKALALLEKQASNSSS